MVDETTGPPNPIIGIAFLIAIIFPIYIWGTEYHPKETMLIIGGISVFTLSSFIFRVHKLATKEVSE